MTDYHGWIPVKSTKCCNADVTEPEESELNENENHPSLYGLANCPVCGKCSEVETEFVKV